MYLADLLQYPAVGKSEKQDYTGWAGHACSRQSTTHLPHLFLFCCQGDASDSNQLDHALRNSLRRDKKSLIL